MKRKLLFAVLCTIAWVNTYAVEWTDKTSVITNPSFETDAATSDLTTCGWATDRVTGWTVLPASASNAQVGIGNSTSKIQGIGSSFNPSAGDKYFYVRQNWNANKEFSIAQTIAAANVPNGLYKLTVKMANFASQTSTFTLSLQEEGKDAVINSITSTSSKWNEWSVMLVKASDATSLTIKAAMLYPGSDAGSRHFSFLLDDVKLEYVSDPSSITAASPLDVTDMIRNHSFENDGTETASPACWTIQSGSDKGAKSNSNATYATTGVDGSYVFNIWGGTAPYKVSQSVKGLPDGYYKLTALIASDQYQNIQVYCGNGKVYDSASDKGTGKDITTAVAYVSNGSMEIGATSYSWFKCDNFRLYYLGASYEASSENPLALTDKASLAWNVAGTTVQWGIQFRETYNGSTTNIVENDRLTQTITGLENGNYRVTLWAEASNANGVSGDKPADGTIVAQLYANDATQDVGLATQGSVAGGTLDLYTLDCEVTTHSLKIGMNATANGANWHIIQIGNLLYTGPLDLSSYIATYNGLVSEAGTAKSTYTGVLGKELTDLNAALDETFDTTSPDAYEDINGRLRSLIDAFVAAAPNYALLETEKTKASNLGMTNEAIAEATPNTKTGLRALQDLKEAEYTYVTTNYSYSVELSDTWTSSGTNTSAANFNNEHWSGTTRNYKNQNDSNGQGWNANSWSINFNQNVLLPAGEYIFKVAARQATDEHVTTSLVVTDTSDDSELGTVNDFPRSNSSRGINKSGETSFNEDASAYANNGNGYGWEWRYVKFTLDSETTVNIAVNVVATANHCWASFGDYTLQTNSPDVEAKLAYNVAIAAANAAYDARNTTYVNVTGDELTALSEAIALDPEASGNSYSSVTTALNEATSAFKEAKDAYDSYVRVKGYADAITAWALPYATSTKIDAVATAKNATVNTAAEAATQTTAINTANRAAYESNAIAENVPGKARTNLITNADGSNVAGWSESFWTADGEAYTEANGNTTNTYFDKNGVKSFTTSQTIKLAKGNYILSVTARAQNGIDSYKMQVTNNAGETEEVALTAMGNQNGVFDRGWNDFYVVFEQKAFGNATITIVGDNTTSDKDFWMSWDRFRLYSIGSEGAYELDEDVAYSPVALEGVDVTLTRNIAADTWSTFVVPFNIDNATLKEQFGDDVEVSEFSADDKTGVTFTPMETPAITANTPVLVRVSSAKSSFTFYGVEIEVPDPTPTVSQNGVNFVGNYAREFVIPGNAYYVKSNTIKKSSGNGKQKLQGFRAYFTVDADSPVKAFFENDIFIDDEATGIVNLNDNLNKNEAIYNLAGQRVQKAQKGLYIVNGRKVVVK